MITENLSTLKIHKLTQEQYSRELKAGNLDENALYLTPDEVACALTINGTSYDGSEAVDITDTVNAMIDAKSVEVDIAVDDALSDTSTNPVQNKVVNSAISNLNTLVGSIPVSTQINNAIYGLTAGNVGIYVQEEEPTDVNDGDIWIDSDAEYEGMAGTGNVSDADTLDGMHASEFASASDLNELQTLVGDSSVSEQITAALDGFSSGKTLAEHLTEEDLVLVQNKHYGDTLPDPGIPGRIFFKKVSS